MTNRFAYILSFDRDDVRDYQKIHREIITMSGIINWFHYIKSSYILISDNSSATEVSRNIRQIMPKKRFLLLRVDLKHRNGLLPQKAWDWIQKQDKVIKEK
ncbi:MAG: hypothetical protein K2L04_02805 [Alistipes sp.]|nr:hypothetical protein [Alistipes sp.]